MIDKIVISSSFLGFIFLILATIWGILGFETVAVVLCVVGLFSWVVTLSGMLFDVLQD